MHLQLLLQFFLSANVTPSLLNLVILHLPLNLGRICEEHHGLFSLDSSEFTLAMKKYYSILNKNFSNFWVSYSFTYDFGSRTFAFFRCSKALSSWELLPMALIITFIVATSSLISNQKAMTTSFTSMVRSLVVSLNCLWCPQT